MKWRVEKSGGADEGRQPLNNTIEHDKPSLQIRTDTEHENQTASENKPLRSLSEICSLQPGRLPGVDVPQSTYCSEGVANFDPS